MNSSWRLWSSHIVPPAPLGRTCVVHKRMYFKLRPSDVEMTEWHREWKSTGGLLKRHSINPSEQNGHVLWVCFAEAGVFCESLKVTAVSSADGGRKCVSLWRWPFHLQPSSLSFVNCLEPFPARAAAVSCLKLTVEAFFFFGLFRSHISQLFPLFSHKTKSSF